MMKPDAKPILFLLTDSTTSLMQNPITGKLDQILTNFMTQDTKFFTVDLGSENKSTNNFGYINHDEHLKYLAYVSSGIHFDFENL